MFLAYFSLKFSHLHENSRRGAQDNMPWIFHIQSASHYTIHLYGSLIHFPQIKYCSWLPCSFFFFLYCNICFLPSIHSPKIFIHLIIQVQVSTIFYYFLVGRTDMFECFIVNLAEFYFLPQYYLCSMHYLLWATFLPIKLR